MTDWADERAREWANSLTGPRMSLAVVESLAALLREVRQEERQRTEAWKERAQQAMSANDGKVAVDLPEYWKFAQWKAAHD